jgi:hypothetical protein
MPMWRSRDFSAYGLEATVIKVKWQVREWMGSNPDQI